VLIKWQDNDTSIDLTCASDTMRQMTQLATILPWAQIVLSVLLIIAILMQRSEAGLGGTFGGDMSGSSFSTKRGAEKWLFIATIVLAVLFAVSSLAALFV
jgi:protein translocase SecG subunit